MFADIFRKYLFKKCQSVKSGKSVDFECNVQGKDICFELKIYNSNYTVKKYRASLRILSVFKS